MKKLILYTTAGCHLCEVAEKLLLQIVLEDDCLKLDIAESNELFHRYGEKIPVLQRPDLKELCWPFDDFMVRNFLSEGASSIGMGR